MSYRSIGRDIADLLEGTDTSEFANCWRSLLLDYISTQLKRGVPVEIEKFLPIMINLLTCIEYIPGDVGDDLLDIKIIETSVKQAKKKEAKKKSRRM